MFPSLSCLQWKVSLRVGVSAETQDPAGHSQVSPSENSQVWAEEVTLAITREIDLVSASAGVTPRPGTRGRFVSLPHESGALVPRGAAGTWRTEVVSLLFRPQPRDMQEPCPVDGGICRPGKRLRTPDPCW